MRRTFALAAVVSLLVSGCGSVNQMMESWVGSSAHELILKWGPPTRTDSDGNGGTVLTYVISEQWVNPFDVPRPGRVYKVGDTWYVEPPNEQEVNTTIKYRQFYVSSAGVIYAWRWQGL